MGIPTAPPTPAPALTVHDPDSLHAVVEGHLTGAHGLSGLDLYYALERSTSLLEFHTMLREGERNRTRDGLQQSYGDHNRLLMLALDRLLAGDVDWLRAHATAGTTVDEDALVSCARTAAALDPAPEVEVALWLGAALHDCGMLCGQGAHVDVEDGVDIARPVLAEFCPAATRALAEFALRHHDYVKDAFLGEVPVSLVADDLARLDPDQQPLGLVALGLIQVAGASSLGEGRLTDFRLAIFHACVAGTALADRSTGLRLARLLAPAPDTPGTDGAVPSGHEVAAARSTLDGLPRGDRVALEPFLECTAVHGWHAFVRDAPPPARLRSLVDLAVRNREWGADHLVISDALRATGSGVLPRDPATRTHRARSGSTVVTVLP